MNPFGLASCLSLALSLTAQIDHHHRPATSLADEVITDCEKLIEAAMKQRGIPGLTVAVGMGGRIVWTRGFGLSDVENKVKATAYTSYRLASISKPITAVAAMQLVAAGRFDLDAPIQKYLPRFPKKRWPVTARLLMSHLGGVRHYKAGEIHSTKQYRTVRAGLAIFAADPLLHEPGTKFHYTTYGYNLLGAAVAAAAGQSFEQTIQESVLKPSGMSNTELDRIRKIIPNRAQGYVQTRGVLYNSAIVNTSNKIPGGGLCGTAADLVNFGQALLTGKLLKRETLDAMWQPARTKAGKSTRYGLGFRIIKADKPRIVGHSGGQPRVSTMLILRPDEGVVVAIMCNLEGGGAATIAGRVSDKIDVH